MFTKLLKFIHQAREKAQHNEAKDRGPVPPVRRASKPKSTVRNQALAPETSKPTAEVAKPRAVPKVAQRGAGKNVMVFAGVDEDADAALERLDRSTSSIKLEEIPKPGVEQPKDGFDPYNSGVFDSKKVWNNSKRS